MNLYAFPNVMLCHLQENVSRTMIIDTSSDNVFQFVHKNTKSSKKNRSNFHILTHKKLEHRYKVQMKQLQQINHDVLAACDLNIHSCVCEAMRRHSASSSYYIKQTKVQFFIHNSRQFSFADFSKNFS